MTQPHALDFPLGAIENGNVFAERLEASELECPAGRLCMSADWQEFRRCFDHLSNWALGKAPAPPSAEQGTPPPPSAPLKELLSEWLKTELGCIDCEHRGDPRYTHDAYWMRGAVELFIDKHRAVIDGWQSAELSTALSALQEARDAIADRHKRSDLQQTILIKKIDAALAKGKGEA